MQFKRFIVTLLGINDNIFQGFNMYDHEWIVKEMIRRYAVNSHDVNIWLTNLLASLTWWVGLLFLRQPTAQQAPTGPTRLYRGLLSSFELT